MDRIKNRGYFLFFYPAYPFKFFCSVLYACYPVFLPIFGGLGENQKEMSFQQ